MSGSLRLQSHKSGLSSGWSAPQQACLSVLQYVVTVPFQAGSLLTQVCHVDFRLSTFDCAFTDRYVLVLGSVVANVCFPPFSLVADHLQISTKPALVYYASLQPGVFLSSVDRSCPVIVGEWTTTLYRLILGIILRSDA